MEWKLLTISRKCRRLGITPPPGSNTAQEPEKSEVNTVSVYLHQGEIPQRKTLILSVNLN